MKLRAATPNVLARLFISIPPDAGSSGREQTVGSSTLSVSSSRPVGGSVIESAFVEEEFKAGVVLNLLAVDAGIEGEHLHSPRFVVETEHGKLGNDAEHAASRQVRSRRGSSARG